MSIYYRIVTSILIFLIPGKILWAQSTQLPDTLQGQNLDAVIVTANKIAQQRKNTGKVISVIGKEVIEKSGGKDLGQLLNEQTGISINGANSNYGKDKSVYLRGASSNYTIILLDGIPLNDPTGMGGAYDVRLIPLSQVERIEILKGSQSTLYGSNAIAGVINIITKKATSTHTEGNGLVAYGSYNTFKGAADFSKKGKLLEYNLNYQYLASDGIAEAKDTTGTGNFPKNGFVQNAFQAKLGVNINEHFKVTPFFRYSDYNGSYSDGPFTGGDNPFNTSLVNTGLVANYTYFKGNIVANYGYDYTKRKFEFENYLGRFNHAEVYINHKISNELQFVGGLNFQSLSTVNSDTTNNILSPYVTVLLSKKGFHLDLGGRFNHHNQYGNNFTYSINPSYLVNTNLKAFANLSSGFRAPSLSEMLPSQWNLANTNLEPEESTNFEAGIQTWLFNKKLSATATYFDRSISNAIIYTTDPVTYMGQYINRDKQHDHGVEIEATYQITKQLSFKGSYAYIYGTGVQQLTQEKDTSFYNLLRRPKNTVNLFVGFQPTPRLFVSTSLQCVGERTDNAYDPVTFTAMGVLLKPYALWNIYGEYHILDNKLVIFTEAKNLTNNTGYYEAYGYNVQGFNINGGIRFKL